MTNQMGQWETRDHILGSGEDSGAFIGTVAETKIGSKSSETVGDEETGLSRTLWFNDHLKEKEATAQLDNQNPATLYYLGRVIKLDAVTKVYVEHRPDGERKHWAVIGSRDFDVMDRIYDIELDTYEKFPMSDLDFRVTVDSGDGPSAAEGAMKIFDRD